jgi:hypothetical protein
MCYKGPRYMPEIYVFVTTCPVSIGIFPIRSLSKFRRGKNQYQLTLSRPRLCAMATLTIVFNLRLESDLFTVSW